MTAQENILIQNIGDIISARMEVREAARRHGMNLTDQACISMTTSSIVNNLLSNSNEGLGGAISIEFLKQGTMIGLRVTCVWQGTLKQPLSYGNAHRMVDDFQIHQDGDRSIEVVMTKWANESNG